MTKRMDFPLGLNSLRFIFLFMSEGITETSDHGKREHEIREGSVPEASTALWKAINNLEPRKKGHDEIVLFMNQGK